MKELMSNCWWLKMDTVCTFLGPRAGPTDLSLNLLALSTAWDVPKKNTKLRGLSPRAKFTDRAIAAWRQS
jgi:hypothetical protein